MRSSRLIALFLTLIALYVFLIVGTRTPAQAAQPGEELVSSSGSLSPGQSITIPLYSTGPANLRLAVSGGAAGDAVTLSLMDNGTPSATWTVLSGETSWGHATIPAGASLRLENTGSSTLAYNLVGYARDTLPSIAEGINTWTGSANGTGINSAIQLDAPSAGLYRFDLDASQGSYQLVVDSDYIRKTVVSGDEPAPTDTTYYLPAGTHTFTVIQDASTADTDWSLSMQPVGGTDSLPIEEHSAVLGGGSFFNEEWIPVQIDAGEPVNVRIETAGAVTDSLTVEVYNSGNKTLTSTDVLGGEINWDSGALTTGANMLHVAANAGNSAPLAYTMTVSAVADAAYSWAGTTYAQTGRPNGGRSSIRLDFPSAGLYTFSFGVDTGRYQFMLDDNYFQKTVEGTDSTTAFVASGTHTMTVAQDESVGAGWQVDVSNAGAANDTLPHTTAGGQIGGTGNSFSEEWQPLTLSAGNPVNLRVSTTGDVSDSLAVAMYSGTVKVHEMSAVYGDEVLWATSALAADGNRLHVAADAGNANAMSYQVDVVPIDDSPSTLQGSSRGVGLNSEVRLNAPNAGTYEAILETTSGAGQLLVDDGSMTTMSRQATANISTTHRVPLNAGLHSFTVDQYTSEPQTDWTLTLRQRNTDGDLADGEELIDSSGSLNASQTLDVPLYSEGPANLRLAVSGGAAGDTVTLALLDDGTQVDTWTVHSGETGWGYPTLPQTGTLQLHNDSGTPLSYDLTVYARDTLPDIADGISTWSGTAHGAGINSAVQVDAPTDGLYRFALDAGQGSYQLVTDNDHIRKTVVSGAAPAPTDTVYYLSAGTHTFTVTQNTNTAATDWQVAIEPVGGMDSLPVQEQSAILGGGAFFNEEWIPIEVGAGEPVNLRIETAGAVTDSVSVELYNDGTPVFTSTEVFGGEINWGSSALATGANALHVVADAGNSAPLAYTVTVDTIAQPAYTWSGTTYSDTSRRFDGQSSIKLDFPGDGLYTFDLSAVSGRYQLMLDSEYLLKTVEMTDTVSAFVSSGMHTLTVLQDPTAGADWQVDVSAITADHDTLPFSRSGGLLGGTGNAFTDEWLPLNVEAGEPVNIRVSAGGVVSDALQLELYNDDSPVYTATTVYGGEVFWATSEVTAGANRLHVIADGNADPMSYTVDVHPVGAIPRSVSGASRGVGLNSTVRFNAFVDGTYNVQLANQTGAAMVLIDETDGTRFSTAATSGLTTTLRVPLTAGLHTFTIEQDPTLPNTDWDLSVSLRQSDETLSLTGVDPAVIDTNTPTMVDITGAGFQAGMMAELIDSTGTVVTPTVLPVSGTEATLHVPALTSDTYDIRVTNPDAASASLTDALFVGWRTYMPVVIR